MNKENYKSLPKIQVSFQDHFCGCPDEITSTVKYILENLSSMNVKPEIGTQILLWEEDEDDNKKYCLCNIGEIAELSEEKIKEYSNTEIPIGSLAQLNNKKIMVKIDRDAYFDIHDLEL